MIDRTFLSPFYAESHLRRGRTVLRAVVPLSIADPALIVDVLVEARYARAPSKPRCRHPSAWSSVAVALHVT